MRDACPSSEATARRPLARRSLARQSERLCARRRLPSLRPTGAGHVGQDELGERVDRPAAPVVPVPAVIDDEGPHDLRVGQRGDSEADVVELPVA